MILTTFSLLFMSPFGLILAKPQALLAYPPYMQVTPQNHEFNSLFALDNVPVAPSYLSDIIRCSNPKDWGLTFDDGPSEFTPLVLDALKARNIKATFFVVGSRVLQRPEVLKRVYQEGHDIGIHTWSHPYLSSLSNQQIVAEIMYTSQAIKDVIGVTPKYMRPPFGDITPRVRGVLKRMGLEIVIWSKDTRDWEGAIIRPEVSRWVQSFNGDISLEHDLLESPAIQSADAMDLIQSAGFSIVPISKCSGRGDAFLSSLVPQFDTTTSTSASTSNNAANSTSSITPTTLSNSSSQNASTSTTPGNSPLPSTTTSLNSTIVPSMTGSLYPSTESTPLPTSQPAPSSSLAKSLNNLALFALLLGTLAI